MTDHYELLGVDADATKDEIKAAYRAEIENAEGAERAELNRAWNVLSDPIQRQRYDDARAVSGDDEGSDADDDAGPVVPARRLTGARRGPESASGGSSNGGSSNGRSGGGDGGDGGDDGGSGRRRLPPTVVLPDNLEMADPKTRSLAMLFDFSVLLVIFLVVQFVGVELINNQYPEQRDRIDALVDQVDKADEAKSDADDAKEKADDRLEAAREENDSAAEADAKAAADRAGERADQADTRVENLNDELLEEQNKLRPMYLLITGVVLVLALLYTVPMSARTGQTIGKRLRKVRLVRADGSPPGFSASLVHYGIPIVLTLALSGFLGPLALIIGLGSVLWNIRDRNRQGFHDKLAKTYVVYA
jgi:curved DNA-binding protein CbpA